MAEHRAIGASIRALQDGWSLVRGLSCLGAGGAAVLGAHLSGGSEVVLSTRMLEVATVVAAVVGSANVVNDIRDAKADLFDKPDRPLPAGRVSVQNAYGLAWLCALVALAVAALIGWAALLVVFGALAVGWLYSFYLKGTVLLGNATIALLDGYCVIYGALYTRGVTPRVIVASILVFLFCFTYLVLLTIRDYTADLAAGIRTVATVLGERAALLIFLGLATVTMAALLFPGVIGWSSDKYLAIVMATTVLPMAAAGISVGRRDATHVMPVAIFLMRLAWFPGLASLTLVR